jgi:thiazole synthase
VIIVDAGVGTAVGRGDCDGTRRGRDFDEHGNRRSQDAAQMATAMKLAVQAGRLAYLSGRMPKRLYASASSPIEGAIKCSDLEKRSLRGRRNLDRRRFASER